MIPLLFALLCSQQPETITGPIAVPIRSRDTVTYQVQETFYGKASYYWEPQMTAWFSPPQGYRRFRRYRPHREPVATAAHKTLPLGSLVRVYRTDREGMVDQVLITDRGPYVRGRVIDLCLKSARRLRMEGPGVVPVRCEVLRYGPQKF